MQKHIHILGICGTFMAGIAAIAKQLNFKVTGSDENVYPPMSTVLDDLGVEYYQGYAESNLKTKPDLVIVGNATMRGNPEFEAVLNQKLNYVSGPQWLAETLLYQRIVLAVAGTHGKTTSTAMLAWCLRELGEDPGYLIGGMPNGFSSSAHLGEKYFVIEADEYDSALFDKRSKFIHYHPDYLILNNLEFDHADIFRDLDDVKRQFHHLLKTIPGDGSVFVNAADKNLDDVVSQGLWSQQINFNDPKAWHVEAIKSDYSQFTIYYQNKETAVINWQLIGRHNAENACVVFAMLIALKFPEKDCEKSLNSFPNVKRRMEIISEKDGITIYDDFAHHPTAIKTTLSGLRAKVDKARIIAVLQFASFTMRTGVHQAGDFVDALKEADIVIVKSSDENKESLDALKKAFNSNFFCFDDTQSLAIKLHELKMSGDHILIMSNSSFDGLYQLL